MDWRRLHQLAHEASNEEIAPAYRAGVDYLYAAVVRIVRRDEPEKRLSPRCVARCRRGMVVTFAVAAAIQEKAAPGGVLLELMKLASAELHQSQAFIVNARGPRKLIRLSPRLVAFLSAIDHALSARCERPLPPEVFERIRDEFLGVFSFEDAAFIERALRRFAASATATDAQI